MILVTHSDRAGTRQHETKKLNVDEQVTCAIEIVRRELQQRNRWPLSGLRPVRHKVFMMIYDRLVLVRASLRWNTSRGSDVSESCHSRIIETVKLLEGKTIDEDTAWDVADALKESLLQIAPPAVVYWALVEEKGREPNWTHNWSKYFPAEELDEAIKKTEKQTEPSERLVALYRIRDGLGRHDRAREGMRWRYLLGVSLVLGISALALLVTWFAVSISADPAVPLMILASVSGIVGAVLSGSLRLRDLGRIVELQAVWRTLLLQTVLGATLAILVAQVLQTDLVTIGNLNLSSAAPAEWSVVGFISGFSEPFALGLLKSITSLGDES